MANPCRVHQPAPHLDNPPPNAATSPRAWHIEDSSCAPKNQCFREQGARLQKALTPHLVTFLGSDGAVAQVSGFLAAMGAKLEAIRGGLVWTAVDAGGIESLSFRDVWTAVDACGIESPPFRAVWTAVDGCGHRLEIYGSEGWGFESLRACHGSPCSARVPVVELCSCSRVGTRILGDFLVRLPRVRQIRNSCST